MTALRLIAWFLFTMFAITMSTEMISEPDTLVMLIGIAIMVATISLSIKTICFLDLKPLRFWRHKH